LLCHRGERVARRREHVVRRPHHRGTPRPSSPRPRSTMTAAASASRPPFVPGTGVVRLTVEGPRGRADLAVPVATTVSALLLALGPKLPDDQGDDSTTWTLQRLGEEPLAPD